MNRESKQINYWNIVDHPPCREEIIMGLITKFCRDTTGVSAVEYGLLLGLIAVVITIGIQTFGTAVSGLFESLLAKWPG
jgi:pilus assembly protein Flp/PilA